MSNWSLEELALLGEIDALQASVKIQVVSWDADGQSIRILVTDRWGDKWEGDVTRRSVDGLCVDTDGNVYDLLDPVISASTA